MKAITLWQPWATLIALGAKLIETRSWKTDYRGPLAIHAASRPPEWTDNPDIERVLAYYGYENGVHQDGPIEFLPRASVVAICELLSCEPTDELLRVPGNKEAQEPFGDFSPGRFGWVLADVVRLETPIRARGRQQLWDWEPPGEIIRLPIRSRGGS